MSLRSTIVVLAAFLSLLGCDDSKLSNGNALSRENAKKLIKSSKTFTEFTSKHLIFKDNARDPVLDCGVEVGILSTDEKKETFKLTDIGKQSGITKAYFDLAFPPRFHLELGAPVKSGDIVVTGIKGLPSAVENQTYKIVEYSYEHEGLLPDAVKGCLKQAGQSLLVLYDDGWRVEESNLGDSK